MYLNDILTRTNQLTENCYCYGLFVRQNKQFEDVILGSIKFGWALFFFSYFLYFNVQTIS